MPQTNDSTVKALIVHGVGPLENRASIEREIEDQFRRRGIALLEAVVFDWNMIVGTQADQVPSVARATFRLILSGGVDTRRLGPANRFRSFSIFALQFTVILIPLALAVGIYETPPRAFSFLMALADGEFSSGLNGFFVDFLGSFMRNRIIHTWLFIFTTALISVGLSEWLVDSSFVIRRVLRQSVLVLGWPLVWVTVVLGYSQVSSVLLYIASPFFVFAVFMAIGGLGNLAFQTGTHQGFFYWSLGLLAVALLFFALSLAVDLISIPFFAAFKRFADVILWLGDLEYRRGLQLKLSRKIREMASGNHELLLIGHSLGTVLLVDYLVSQVVRQQRLLNKRIRLVTMGSPLKSLISRYYAESFASPAAIFDSLVSTHPDFGWVNTYRPKDFVGKEVGLGLTPRSADLSTNEHNLRGIRTHSDYWSDPVVWDVVAQAINKMESLKPSDAELVSSTKLIWPSDGTMKFDRHTVTHSEQTHSAGSRVIIISVFSLMPLTALVFVILLPWQRYRVIESEGVETNAIISCQAKFNSSRMDSGYYSIDSCVVAFTDNRGDLHTEKVDGIDTDGFPSTYDFMLGLGFSMKGDNVRVIYDPGNPENVVVKRGTAYSSSARQFRLLATPLDWLYTRLFGVILTSIFISVLVYRPLLALAVALGSFFGVDFGPFYLSK